MFLTPIPSQELDCLGTHVLVTATTDVDKSDKSYYGVSHLYVLCSTSRESFQVPLDKEGPLHAVEWNPTGREFCVCYGFMPSKVGRCRSSRSRFGRPNLNRTSSSKQLFPRFRLFF